MSQHQVVLLLGSNLGDPQKNIETAILELEKIGQIRNQSEFYFNSPVEFKSDLTFCNLALVMITTLSPVALLKYLKNIEKKMGRFQDSQAYGFYIDRIIDIDIVRFDNLKFRSKNLIIPHEKHCFERAFSKYLLAQIKIDNY